MSYFAKVPTITDGKGIVDNVIAIEQSVIDTGAFGDPSMWWQTSYNTHGNVHYGADGQPDGGVALRANYAGLGYTFDKTVVQDGVIGVFYAPQPGPLYILNTKTYLWELPQTVPSTPIVMSLNPNTGGFVPIVKVENNGGSPITAMHFEIYKSQDSQVQVQGSKPVSGMGPEYTFNLVINNPALHGIPLDILLRATNSTGESPLSKPATGQTK